MINNTILTSFASEVLNEQATTTFLVFTII